MFFEQANSGLFLIYFCLLKHYNFYNKHMRKCPTSIRCWDLNPRPSEHESPPITTRSVLPPIGAMLCCQIIESKFGFKKVFWFEAVCHLSKVSTAPDKKQLLESHKSEWQCLWLSWQSGSFQRQKSVVRILSLAKFRYRTFVHGQLYWIDEKRKK